MFSINFFCFVLFSIVTASCLSPCLLGIKTISSEKFLTTVIEARSKQFSSEKIKTVGILFDYDQFVDYEYFRMLFTDLGLNDNRLRFIVFYEKENNQPNSWDASYTKTDFDWLGHCKSNEVTEFVDQSFDLLITYTV
mgnify:CR=1 FL=1